MILIEVNQVGQSKGADRQLFEYAFHKGVPMAILTDGQEWNFFLPTEQGYYSERQLYKLDILVRDPQQAESSFKRYLEYDAVRSGQAIEAARRDYRNAARRRQAQRTLPDAWANLCGVVRPDPDAVVAFLRKKPTSMNEAASATSPKSTKQTVQPATGNGSVQRYVGYTLDGLWHPARSAREVMVKVFDDLANRDPTFLERFAALPKARKETPVPSTHQGGALSGQSAPGPQRLPAPPGVVVRPAREQGGHSAANKEGLRSGGDTLR